MKIFLSFLVLLITAIMTIGVFHASAVQPRAEHGVSWYVSHPVDRENVLQKCNDDHSLDSNGDCRNATAAAARSVGTGKTNDDALDSDPAYSVAALKANEPMRKMVLGFCKGNQAPPASVCRNAREAQGATQ
jgi:Na+-transporting methylmalonyl-CoA/oxaloacetate decarboxylase gamma subunit